jgi:hypothetical protein
MASLDTTNSTLNLLRRLTDQEVDFQWLRCRVLKLDALIRAKRAAGRSKDLLALPELEALPKMRPP